MERSFEQDRYNALLREEQYRRLRGETLRTEDRREADDELEDARQEAIEAQKRINRAR